MDTQRPRDELHADKNRSVRKRGIRLPINRIPISSTKAELP